MRGEKREWREGVTVNFRFWLMTRDAQLAGWVCDCQENKKENEEEIHGQQTDKILLELGNIFSSSNALNYWEWFEQNET